ncbi:MAG TPA: ABC transporter ATP-binding protein [Aggregatilineales bacterium]|nr:ABC transporter ATP-binding protein [Aggregatilineales bacterium]
MGFLFDGLDAESYDRNYSDRQLVRRIVSYFKPEMGRILAVAVMVVIGSLANTGVPIAVSRVLDAIVQDNSTPTLIRATLLVTLLACVAWVVNLIRRTLTAQAVGNVVLSLREQTFDAVVRRDLSFYDSIPSGKIVSRVTSDTQAFSQTVTLAIELIAQTLLVIILVSYLLTVDASLTLVMIGMAPIIVGLALGFRRIARFTVTNGRRVRAEVSAHVQETVAGISVAKTFRQEQAIYEEFKVVNAQSFRINLRTGWVFSGIFPILNILAGVGAALLLYFGGVRAQLGAITPGNWYLFIQGMIIFWFPLTSIASFWSQFQLGLAAGERVFALLDAEPKVVQLGNEKLGDVRGEIRFKHVDFSYNVGEAVLHNFSLDIPAGQSLALVGHTGAGKSSIGKLIARFYEFQGGQITVDGYDIRNLDLRAYRAHLGIVTQSPFLFDGTVMENIRYGRSNASDAEVIDVAHKIGGGDWISSLPNGLHSEVGERGAGLSMGQRQLVALARVQLQAPSIFILDEATASIDPFTETLIQEGLDVVLKDRTSIIIAHRLSTIKSADRIIVLREGSIIEEGTHESLLTEGGHYAELYNTYFRHQSLEYIEAAKAI